MADAKGVFYRYLDETPADLTAFLVETCGDDERLRHDVKGLIRAHNADVTLLGEPAVGARDAVMNLAEVGLERTAVGAPAAEGPRDVPGRVGPYEIIEELGRGGAGVVYKARHPDLGRTVALKMSLGGPASDAEDLARFRAEAEAVAALDHPHVVKIFEVGTHNGWPYFALEYCPAGSLEPAFRDGPMPPKGAAGLIERVARGVAAAHALGVVHRDLKPANVLAGPDGSPKVTDFGLAKRADEAGLTATGIAVGTPQYMAPEQATGQKRVGPAVDVWALGVMLYRGLTGEMPFDGGDAFSVLRRAVEGEPPRPRSVNRSVPRDLEVICLKCLRKDPGARYVSADALADDLGRWLAGVPIQARPVGRPERAWKWVWRNKGLTAAGVALVGGAAALLLLFIEAEHSRREAERSRRLAERYALFIEGELFGAARPDRAVTLAEAMRSAEPRVPEKFADMPVAAAFAYQSMGMAWMRSHDYEDAVRTLALAAGLHEGHLRHGPPGRDRHHRFKMVTGLVACRSNLALALTRSGRADEAVRLLRKTLPMAVNELGEGHPAVKDCRDALWEAEQGQ